MLWTEFYRGVLQITISCHLSLVGQRTSANTTWQWPLGYLNFMSTLIIKLRCSQGIQCTGSIIYGVYSNDCIQLNMWILYDVVRGEIFYARYKFKLHHPFNSTPLFLDRPRQCPCVHKLSNTERSDWAEKLLPCRTARAYTHIHIHTPCGQSTLRIQRKMNKQRPADST